MLKILKNGFFKQKQNINDEICPIGQESGRRLFLRRYGYLGLCFAVPVFLMLVIDIFMEVYPVNPLGNSTLLILDMNAQYVSFFEGLRNIVTDGGTYLYSFCRSLGGEFMGMYAYYLASPLSYIVCLFPQGKICEAILCLLTLKTGISGLTFGYYLHRTGGQKPRKILVVMFSVLYALCSYGVVYQHNTMWMDAMMWLPLVILGTEQLVRYGRMRMFTVFLTLTIWSNFYLGYMCCLFVLLYFFVYYFGHDRKDRNPLQEKNHFLKSFTRIGFCSLVALGVTALILLTTVYSMQFGKTTYTTPKYIWEFKADLLDTLAKFLPAAYDDINTQRGLPQLYCGVSTLLLVPVYFMSPKIRGREKLAHGLLILFMLASLTVSMLILVWHMFQYPICLNGRNSIFLCFLLLVLAFRGLRYADRHSVAPLWGTAGVLCVFVVILQKMNLSWFDDFKNVALSLFAIIVLAAVINILLVVPKKRLTQAVLLSLVCLEVFGSGLLNFISLSNEVGQARYSRYTSFIAGLRPSANEIRARDTGFYRMEKTAYRHKNDNFALRLRGLGGSTSTLNRETISFLNRMGYSSRSHWVKYLDGGVVNDSLLGIKYVISDKDLGSYFESVFADGDTTVWKNPYALSLAFAASDAVLDFGDTVYESSQNPFEYMNRLVTALLGESKTVQLYVPVPMDLREDASLQSCTSRFTDGHLLFTATADGAGYVTVNCEVPTGKELFFYCPAAAKYLDVNYPLELTVNYGEETYQFGDADNIRIVPIGSYDESEMVLTVRIMKKTLYVDRWDSLLYYVDDEVLEDVFARLQKTQFIPDDNCSDSRLTGSLSSENDGQLIFTTIPYDEGWQIFVDGERAELLKTCDALIAFRVDAGDHRIVMKYRPSAFTAGLIITLCSLALCIAFLVLQKQIARVPVLRILSPVPVPGKDGQKTDIPQEDAPAHKDLPEDLAQDGPPSEEETRQDEEIPDEEVPGEEDRTEEAREGDPGEDSRA